MSTFLSFIGILAIGLFLKFLYDTFVLGKRYSPDGQLIESQDTTSELESIKKKKIKEGDYKYEPLSEQEYDKHVDKCMEHLQDFEKRIYSSARETEKKEYFKALLDKGLSASQLKEEIDKWKFKNLQVKKNEDVQISENRAWYVEQWLKDFFYSKGFEMRKRTEAEILIDFVEFNNLDRTHESVMSFQNQTGVKPNYSLAKIESPYVNAILLARESISKNNLEEAQRIYELAHLTIDPKSSLRPLLLEIYQIIQTKSGEVFSLLHPTQTIDFAIKLKSEEEESYERESSLANFYDTKHSVLTILKRKEEAAFFQSKSRHHKEYSEYLKSLNNSI